LTREEFDYWLLRGQTKEVFKKLKERREGLAEGLVFANFLVDNLAEINRHQGKIEQLDELLNADRLFEVIR